jgi:hypothetical protein
MSNILARMFTRTRSWIERESKLHPQMYLWLQFACLCGALYLGIHPPAPGVAVLLLGVVAAIMTTQPHMTDNHRVGWILIICILFIVEFRSIGKDRREHDQEQAAARLEEKHEFERILKQDQEHFDTTIGQLNKTLVQDQKHFDTTIVGLKEVIGSSRATMERTNEVLTSITGGKSYGIVIPVVPHLNEDGSVLLGVENHGDKHSLTGVSVTVYKDGVWIKATHNSIVRSISQRVNIGTLHQGERLVLGISMKPDALAGWNENGSKVFRCMVYIAAQNYTVEETLDFKRDETGTNWLYRYQAYRRPPNINPDGKVNTEGSGPLIEAADWSSDMNNPMRTKEVTWH